MVEKASVIQILRSHLELPPDLDEDRALADFGLDSVGLVNIFLALEEELGFRFPEELMMSENFSTLAKIMQSVESASPGRETA